MPKYIAFLRAINVGGHTVKMDQLKKLFEGLGFANVETFIASGNVIFDSPSKTTAALEKKIESFLEKSLGYKVATFLRTPAELTVVVKQKPFGKIDETDTLYVGFMTSEPDKTASGKLVSSATPVDDFRVKGREVYWLLRTRFSESQFTGARLEKILERATTLRNVTTVRKLAAKYSS